MKGVLEAKDMTSIFRPGRTSVSSDPSSSKRASAELKESRIVPGAG
jgi:hypothetical protein